MNWATLSSTADWLSFNWLGWSADRGEEMTVDEAKAMIQAVDDVECYYRRTCVECGEKWWSLHCKHDGNWRPCPNGHPNYPVPDDVDADLCCEMGLQTDEDLKAYGYVLTEGGIWELDIPVDILKQIGTPNALTIFGVPTEEK
jgi:hypothetical protein